MPPIGTNGIEPCDLPRFNAKANKWVGVAVVPSKSGVLKVGVISFAIVPRARNLDVISARSSLGLVIEEQAKKVFQAQLRPSDNDMVQTTC